MNKLKVFLCLFLLSFACQSLKGANFIVFNDSGKDFKFAHVSGRDIYRARAGYVGPKKRYAKGEQKELASPIVGRKETLAIPKGEALIFEDVNLDKRSSRVTGCEAQKYADDIWFSPVAVYKRLQEKGHYKKMNLSESRTAKGLSLENDKSYLIVFKSEGLTDIHRLTDDRKRDLTESINRVNSARDLLIEQAVMFCSHQDFWPILLGALKKGYLKSIYDVVLLLGLSTSFAIDATGDLAKKCHICFLEILRNILRLPFMLGLFDIEEIKLYPDLHLVVERLKRLTTGLLLREKMKELPEKPVERIRPIKEEEEVEVVPPDTPVVEEAEEILAPPPEKPKGKLFAKKPVISKDPRAGLLEAIKKGVQLKHVSPEDLPPEMHPKGKVPAPPQVVMSPIEKLKDALRSKASIQEVTSRSSDAIKLLLNAAKEELDIEPHRVSVGRILILLRLVYHRSYKPELKEYIEEIFSGGLLDKIKTEGPIFPQGFK